MNRDQDSRQEGTRLSRSLRKRVEGGRSLGLAALIPTMMWVGPVAGFLLGRWIESLIGYSPWPEAIGMLLGLVASVRQIVNLIRRSRDSSS